MRPRAGVYRLRDFPSGPHEDLWAALTAAGPDAVLSHETALALHQLSDVVPRGVDLKVPYEKRWLKPRSIAPHARLHVTRRAFQPADISHVEGLRVTAPIRTLIDVARDGTNPRQVVLAMKQALERHLAAPDAIMRTARTSADRRTLARVAQFMQEATE